MASIPSKQLADLSSPFVDIPVDLAQWLIVSPLVIAITFSTLLFMFRNAVRFQAPIAILGCALIFSSSALLLSKVLIAGSVTMMVGSWLAPFGIVLTADILGASFSFFASIVAFFVCIYAAYEIKPQESRHGFYPFLLLMVLGVNGCFLTGDIFNFYVWLEVILISSFGLLIFGSRKIQLDGAIKYAFMNFIGTTLYLIATGYLYGLFGTLNMADIAIKMRETPFSVSIITVYALYLLALGIKAAVFPVNFWLPASYHTPKIAVSALFAGLLTKIGIYALLRINIMMFDNVSNFLTDVIIVLAIFTMLSGALGALVQTDIRRIAGYLLISGIGSMLAGIGLVDPIAIGGVIFYAFQSMIMLTAFYIMTSMIFKLCGSFELNKLGGIYKLSPVLSFLFFIIFLSISGLPPGSGFWPKLILIKAALAQNSWVLSFCILASGLLTTITLGRLWMYAFWKDPINQSTMLEVTEKRFSVNKVLLENGLVPFTVLVVIGTIMGLLPDLLLKISFNSANLLLSPQPYLDSVFDGS